MNVDFVQAIKLFFNNYANFNGRSTRAEFWFATLFIFLVSAVCSVIPIIGWFAFILFSLAVIIPQISITVRRLHDTGRSGWWLVGYFVVQIALGAWLIVKMGPLFKVMMGSLDEEINFETEAESIEFIQSIMWPYLCMLAFGIVYIVFMCLPSGRDNQYGPNPYGGFNNDGYRQ